MGGCEFLGRLRNDASSSRSFMSALRKRSFFSRRAQRLFANQAPSPAWLLPVGMQGVQAFVHSAKTASPICNRFAARRVQLTSLFLSKPSVRARKDLPDRGRSAPAAETPGAITGFCSQLEATFRRGRYSWPEIQHWRVARPAAALDMDTSPVQRARRLA